MYMLIFIIIRTLKMDIFNKRHLGSHASPFCSFSCIVRKFSFFENGEKGQVIS